MKVIIAGSRHCIDYGIVSKAIVASGFDRNFGISEIICGKARGVDSIGEIYAKIFDIQVESFPADWNGPHKKAAGFIRNQAMADYAEPEVDGLIAVWDGKSTGTLDMIRRANKRNLRVFIFNYNKEPR